MTQSLRINRPLAPKAKSNFLRGVKAGFPIGLGYLSVSFTFGLNAIALGLNWWQAVIISLMTVTSAGQFSGIKTMATPGLYFEMLISQLTINVRYSFMSISLSQKTDRRFNRLSRWLLGFFVTDEIFAVASSEESVSRSFFAGLAVLPYIGWGAGTLIGALLGNILPGQLLSALGLAIYGMFVAIVIPDTKKDRSVLFVVLLSAAISCALYYLPVLNQLSSGLAVSICAIVAAVIGAIFFPVKDGGSSEIEDSKSSDVADGSEPLLKGDAN